MVIGILNFGEGSLPLNYLIFCCIASLGAIQIAAAQARLVGLLLLPIRYSRMLGVVLIVGSYIWFFAIQPDLFIPGLAGGELFTLFFIGFGIGVLLSLGFGIISNRMFARRTVHQPEKREMISLGGGQRAELWLPDGSLAPLILAFREADTDSLDILSGELVAVGAAVLLCDESAAQAATEWAERQAARFSRCCLMGVGRGADRAIALAPNSQFQCVLALAPFGDSFHARPGLRWLRETDYLTGMRATWGMRPIESYPLVPHVRVIYGDEDLLIRPSDAREMFPDAIMVAGARHLTLAGMPAVLRLATDLLELHAHTTATPLPASGQGTPVRTEASE